MRLAVIVGTLFVASPALALEPAAQPHSFTATEGLVAQGVPVEAVLGGEVGEASWVARTGGEQAALGGLDPVSFFEPGGPKPGRPAYRAEYHGSVFYFADARHRDLFLNAPERFAPIRTAPGRRCWPPRARVWRRSRPPIADSTSPGALSFGIASPASL